MAPSDSIKSQCLGSFCRQGVISCLSLCNFLGLASSSSCGTEQPATLLCSAEQPAWKTASMRDVQRWLAADHVAGCSGVKRIEGAVAVLSRPLPRKEDVRPLQSKWQVAQQKNRKQKTDTTKRCAPRAGKQGGSRSAEVITAACRQC